VGGAAAVTPLLFLTPTLPPGGLEVTDQQAGETKLEPILGVKSAQAAALSGDAQPVALVAKVERVYPRREERVARMVPETKYEEALFRAADEFGISRDLFWALARQESVNFNPYYVEGPGTSPAGARGLTQVLPSTGAAIAAQLGLTDYHPDKLFDPFYNARLGAFYLRQQLDANGGNIERALRAYNAGPNAVDASYQYAETNTYVERVLANQQHIYDVRINRPDFGAIFASGFQVTQGPGVGTHSDALYGPWGDGFDLIPADPNDTLIHAPFEGAVVELWTATENPVGGNSLVLRSPSGRYEMYFGHLAEVWVQRGQTVAYGDVLGVMGMTGKATGPHTHISPRVIIDGVRSLYVP